MRIAFQFDVLEQDALEILRLIRTWKNDVAPINRIPPEILALIPDFWDTYDGGGGVIALTHVCRAWREVFTSRSSLWANINCEDADKTLVYFERSKSSPINLALYRDDALSPCDPFVRIIPHAIERLKSLSIKGTPMNLQDITANLPRPAPLLEELSIHGGRENARHLSPVLASVLFNGDLSLLRKLRLESVRTELPWRNMVNLTSFTLAHTLPGEVSVRRLLDFFEGAPHLHAVKLHSATRTSGARDKRLVSLALLKTMVIINGGPSSLLLSHLLIPAGAKLTTQMDSPRFLIEDHLPRSLSNLRNLSNFTTIELYGHDSCPHIRFSGPNGQVTIRGSSQFCGTSLVLGSLTQFDTSEVKRLEIYCGNSPSSDLPYHALLSMKDLRSLTLSRCKSPHTFIHALHPSVSPSGILACPNWRNSVSMGRYLTSIIL